MVRAFYCDGPIREIRYLRAIKKLPVVANYVFASRPQIVAVQAGEVDFTSPGHLKFKSIRGGRPSSLTGQGKVFQQSNLGRQEQLAIQMIENPAMMDKASIRAFRP